jgi:hypothetical protein
MPITNYIAGGFTEAQIQAMIQTELATNPPGSQVPRYSSAPVSTTLGLKYYNTTDNKEYMYTSTGWVEIDIKEGIVLQGLDGDVGSGLNIVADKLVAKVDGTSISIDGSGNLQTVVSPTVINDLVSLSGLTANSTTLGTFTGSIIPDAQTVKAAIQALETAIESTNIAGQFAGSATTFAGLPTTTADGKVVNNGDWAILTVDNAGNQSGVYAYNGTAYVLAKEIPEVFALVVVTANSNSITLTGNGNTGTELTAALKVDPLSSNLLKVTASGTKVDPVDVKAVLTFTDQLQGLDGTLIGYVNSSVNFA